MNICFILFLDTPDENESGLFSVKIYKQHIIPRLIQMFCVRDTQIRLLLLSHFSKYFQTFTVKELKKQILPEVNNFIMCHLISYYFLVSCNYS